MSRPAKAVIDLSALRDNYRLAQSLAPEARHLAVVKANAYGHSATECARALNDLVPAFGVACIEEALALRAAGITKPVLLLEGTFSADEVSVAADQQFWLMVENEPQIEAIEAAGKLAKLKVWMKIDSGMHRLGLQPEQLGTLYQRLSACDNVAEEIVLATHFACADDLENPFTERQIERFLDCCEGIAGPKSLANSAGLMGWPTARADWNRPGFMLYGNSPFEVPHPVADQLKPVMRLESAVISVREIEAGETVGYAQHWKAERRSRIATVAIGYGDGYPRHAPAGTPVLVNGQRVPLVGRVSMDMVTLDVTDLASVAIGDPVILWGPQLSVNEVAESAGTIGYELLTRMTGRVPLHFVGTEGDS